jgi:hypothetical protein
MGAVLPIDLIQAPALGPTYPKLDRPQANGELPGDRAQGPTGPNSGHHIVTPSGFGAFLFTLRLRPGLLNETH